MSKKIAIVDIINHDIGLKILFPEADYYVLYDEIDKSQSLAKYNINKKYDIENINDGKYDYVFIIVAFLNAIPGSLHLIERIKVGFNKIIDIINKNNFKKVFLFDNYDYDYDPNDFLQNNKIDLFFKRNYSKKKQYKENVIPFSFIMFGQYSMIETLDMKRNLSPQVQNRIFFAGTLFEHIDNEFKYYRNREKLFHKISRYLFTIKNLHFNDYINIMNTSRFSLDLNGVGDPNKRTFEILAQGSLRIAEYNDLLWSFNEDFSEETIFHDENDFVKKIELLMNDNELYNKCLARQNEIVNKYCNVKWIREYIEKYMI